MPQGLAIPIRTNPTGGLATSEGDAQDHKIISLALGSGESENAFQEIGLGDGMIFDAQDGAARVRIAARLHVIFEEFERLRRFKLRSNTIEWVERDGELELSFLYVSLEANEERDFRTNFRGGG
jgi:hypothetical protein